MATSIITDKFRIENAKKFIQSIKAREYPADYSGSSDYEENKVEPLESNTDVLYMTIGKITSWYDEHDLPIHADTSETPVPDVNKNLRQESEIWSNTIVAKKVNETNITHTIPRQNWVYNEVYPYYSSNSSNISTYNDPSTNNFYILDEEEFRVYKCLFNNYGSQSQERPTMINGIVGDSRRIQSEPFYTTDGYLWKYMYTVNAAESIDFVTDGYIPLHKDNVNDDNSTKDGAIYRIFLPDKVDVNTVMQTPGGNDVSRIKLDGITVSDVSTNELTIDMTSTYTNGDRIGSNEMDDMVGYQVEHIMQDVNGTTIEIGKIVSSNISTGQLLLTIERLDDNFDTTTYDAKTVGFSDGSTADTNEWFIAPMVDVQGEGQFASAMLRLYNETGFNAISRKHYPTDDVTTNGIIDVVMNTVGSGYRNIYYRNDFDNQLNSYVYIRQGKAKIGAAVGEGEVVLPESDRDIANLAEIVSITPTGGHSSDNVSELYGFNIMINHNFVGNESELATVSNDFRQVSLIQNPLDQDGLLANAYLYRQTIRLEFDGDITNDIYYDDEISDKSSDSVNKTTFGRIVKWEVDTIDASTKYTKVYLSSTDGFFDKTADEVYNLNSSHNLYLSHEIGTNTSPYTPFTLSTRFIDNTSDGAYQKGIASDDDVGLQFMSGEMMYIENRQPIVRSIDQTENIKLIIEY